MPAQVTPTRRASSSDSRVTGKFNLKLLTGGVTPGLHCQWQYAVHRHDENATGNFYVFGIKFSAAVQLEVTVPVAV